MSGMHMKAARRAQPAARYPLSGPRRHANLNKTPMRHARHERALDSPAGVVKAAGHAVTRRESAMSDRTSKGRGLSRRTFLKSTAAVGLGVVASPAIVSTAALSSSG